jgi:TRAP-type mannitol/chloroaromatic compound transport system substrate-binding protein
MQRRNLIAGAAGGAAGTLAMPAVATAQTTFNWRMTSFYGRRRPSTRPAPARRAT